MTKAKDNRSPKGKPTRRSRRRQAPPQEWSRRAQEAIVKLEQLGQEVLRTLHRVAPESSVDAIQVPVRLSLTKSSRDAGVALVKAIEREVRESLLAAAAFSRGKVYCLRCENSICEHATPPGPRFVFSGYGQTGRAEWVEFDQLMTDRKDPRRGLLYEERAPRLTIAMGHDSLYSSLLPGFEAPKRRFLVLAQMCVSPFLPELAKDTGREPMALTVQLVQTMRTSDQCVMGVNLLGNISELPETVLEDTVLPGLGECLAPIRREMAALTRRSRGKPPQTGIALQRLQQRSLTLIRELCRDVEHISRATKRRTRHAIERSQQADRPTSKAFEDACAASHEDILQDTLKKTIVVIGQRGRVHFFSDNGKHVSSVVFEGRTIRQRIARKRWVPLPQERTQKFHADLTAANPSP